MDTVQVTDILDRLRSIEGALNALVRERTVKDWYSTDEVAELLGRAPFTVRQWCRLARIRAKKRLSGRGCSQEWMIARDELLRIQNEGLLPLRRSA